MEEIHGAESKKVLNKELPVSFSHGVTDSVTFLVMMCDNIHGVLPTREIHLGVHYGVDCPSV